MKIFVAGATGVIGRRLLPRLAAAGHRVAGLSRSPRNRELLETAGAEPRDGSLFDPDMLRRAVSDADAIVNLASSIPAGGGSPSDWALNDRIRREGTERLLDAAAAGPCRLFLQAGVAFLHGDRKGEWVDESVPPADDLPAMLRSAVEMEGMVQRADAGSGMSSVILRFGSLYARDAAHTTALFSGIGRRAMPLIGGGTAFWNPIHADDAASAVVAALDQAGVAAGKTYHVCDDGPAPFAEIARFIAVRLGAPAPRSVPRWLARLRLGRDLTRFLTASVRFRTDAIRNDLGWRPARPTYREGYAEELDAWIASRGR